MSKQDAKKLYEKYGGKICLAPFLNSFYATGHLIWPTDIAQNRLKPCTIIKSYGWYTQNSSLKETRNNDTWKQMRQDMLDGKMDEIPGCKDCSHAEKIGASSARQLNNDYLFEHLDIDIMAEMEKIVSAGLVTDSIYALDYMPSNYCNYACVMCDSSASSQRYTFDVKNGSPAKYVIHPVESDFLNLLKDVKILGFAGGETILQPEVHHVMDYLIEQDLAKNIIITMLTNASSFPDSLVEKFNKFKRVLYTVSVDGIGDVIEYQRRGAVWSTVEKNVLKIHQTPTVHEIVNHVVTGINILSAMNFVDWCHANDLKYITITPVYQQNVLGISVLPPELKNLALHRLKVGRKRYDHYLSAEYKNSESNYVLTIDRLINTIENSEFNPTALENFIKHIHLEDTASKKPLREVVPEWAPWFN